jgi:hypothetical protein
MSHSTVAEPIAKRVDSEVEQLYSEAERDASRASGRWKMEFWGILSVGARRTRVAQQCRVVGPKD